MRLEDLQGRRLGRYEIVSLLGRGGMAAVYRAHDTALRRDVALKVLFPQYSGDRTLIDRFEREAVLAAGLDHPNIVPIYDVGAADGLVYIAMKLLGGRSLADVLRRTMLPLGEVVSIVEQIAAALDYAHARNIIHRDIKAGNILLEQDSTGLQSGPRAILTDFGIAKSLAPDASGLTGTGVLIGTPDYMAPEQIRGSQAVDYRADIYALGVLAFRCLTGRLPFEGGTEQVLLGHLYGSISDPSMLAPALPAAADPVIRKALARDPADRYQRAGDFGRALREAAGQKPPTPPLPPRRDSAGRMVSPGGAADGSAQRRAATQRDSSMPTWRGDVGPPRRADVGPPRRAAVGPIILAVLLVLLVGGLLFAGMLRRGAVGGVVGTPTTLPVSPAPPTEPPAPTATSGEPATTTPVEPATAAPPSPSAPAATPAPTATSTRALPPPATPTLQPTATPTSEPSATPTLQPTATPTSEPSATPSPTPCPAPLTGGFGRLWSQNAQVRDRIGCSIEAEQGGPTTIAEQPFERGSMLYYDPLGRVYVLFGKNGGRWRLFEERELRDLPTPTPAAEPPCPAPLIRGFGLVWSTFPEVREALGCSTAPEDGLLEGAYQPFENGAMLFSQKGLGRGKTLYVLYADGDFDRYDDPNP